MGMFLYHIFRHFSASVITAYFKSVICHIECQASAHDCQAYDSYICFLHNLPPFIYSSITETP